MDTASMRRVWWAIALRGAPAILFGLVALFYPGATLQARVYVVGAVALLNGLFAIVAAARAGAAHLRWGWLALAGVAGVAAGVVSFARPGVTALAFVYLVAAWAIISGVAGVAF